MYKLLVVQNTLNTILMVQCPVCDRWAPIALSAHNQEPLEVELTAKLVVVSCEIHKAELSEEDKVLITEKHREYLDYCNLKAKYQL